MTKPTNWTAKIKAVLYGDFTGTLYNSRLDLNYDFQAQRHGLNTRATICRKGSWVKANPKMLGAIDTAIAHCHGPVTDIEALLDGYTPIPEAVPALPATPALDEYIDQRNAFIRLFNKHKGDDEAEFNSRCLTADQAENLYQNLDGDMSPENLHCDGEISAAAAAKKAKHFRQCVKDLKALGFEPQGELYCI